MKVAYQAFTGLKTAQKCIVLVAAPLVTSTLFLVILSVMLNRAHVAAQQEAHTKEILLRLHRIEGMTKQTAYDCVHFVVTHSRTLNNEQQAKIINQQFDQLEALVSNDSDLTRGTKQLRQLDLDAFIWARDYEAATPDNMDEANPFDVVTGLLKARRSLSHIVDQTHALAEQVLAKQAQHGYISAAAWLWVITLVLGAGLLANVALSFFLSNMFGKSMSERLQVLVDNSLRIGSGQPLNPPLPGTDEIAALDGVFHDMAAKLAEAQTKEKAVVDEAFDVICSLDSTGRFVAVNPAAATNWSYPPDELLGRHMTSIVVNDDVMQTRLKLQELIASNHEGTFENRIQRADGTTAHVLWSALWSVEEKLFLCIAHDITVRTIAEQKLRQDEARLRQILNNMPVGLLIASKDGLIETTNTCLQYLWDYSEDELLGKPIAVLFQLPDDGVDDNLIAEMQATDRARPTEKNAITKHARTFPVEVLVSELYIFGEMKLLCVANDIRQRKEIERLKNEFVSMVSHDLKTPLTTIMVTLHALLSGSFGKLNDAGQGRIAATQGEVERLMRLINGLLDVEKITTGHVEIKHEIVDLNDLIERSMCAVGYLAEKNGVQLAKHVEAEDACGDTSGLIQVLINLLANAIKYSPTGSTVNISVSERDGTVEFAVSDQGKGIPPDLCGDIFERFKQVEKSDRIEKGGTGLGLAICKTIVEAHGGTIGVTSSPGCGSTFWFRIPVEME